MGGKVEVYFIIVVPDTTLLKIPYFIRPRMLQLPKLPRCTPKHLVVVTLLLSYVYPNHPTSCKILQGALFGENSTLLETGTFTSSNGAKLLPCKKYRP